MGYSIKDEFFWKCSCGTIQIVSGSQLNAKKRFCSPDCPSRNSDKSGEILSKISEGWFIAKGTGVPRGTLDSFVSRTLLESSRSSEGVTFRRKRYGC